MVKYFSPSVQVEYDDKDFIIEEDVAESIIKGICQVNDHGKSADLKEVLKNENLGKNIF